MARAPRAKVSKTAGQGVSRLSYQKARALTGDAPQAKVSFSKGGSGERRDYSKKAKPIESGDFNVSYGDTVDPTDIEDVKALGEGKPAKGWSSERKRSKMKGL